MKTYTLVKLLRDGEKTWTHDASLGCNNKYNETWIVGEDDGLGTLYLCKTSFQAWQVSRGMAQADLVVHADQVVEMETF